MNSPCNDCKRRSVGCHNADTCKPWGEYVEKVRMAREQRFEDMLRCDDWKRHVKRHGATLKER